LAKNRRYTNKAERSADFGRQGTPEDKSLTAAVNRRATPKLLFERPRFPLKTQYLRTRNFNPYCGV